MTREEMDKFIADLRTYDEGCEPADGWWVAYTDLQKAADALEQAQQEIEDLLSVKSYSDSLTEMAKGFGYSYAGKAMDGQHKRIKQLEAALRAVSEYPDIREYVGTLIHDLALEALQFDGDTKN